MIRDVLLSAATGGALIALVVGSALVIRFIARPPGRRWRRRLVVVPRPPLGDAPGLYRPARRPWAGPR